MRQWGQSGDGCVEAAILCRYDRRKGDLFVLRWARVRRVCRGKFSSVLLSRGGCVCIFAFMSAVVTVQGSVGMFVVYRELLKVVGFISRCEVLCVVYLYSGCEGIVLFV